MIDEKRGNWFLYDEGESKDNTPNYYVYMHNAGWDVYSIYVNKNTATITMDGSSKDEYYHEKILCVNKNPFALLAWVYDYLDTHQKEHDIQLSMFDTYFIGG